MTSVPPPSASTPPATSPSAVLGRRRRRAVRAWGPLMLALVAVGVQLLPGVPGAGGAAASDAGSAAADPVASAEPAAAPGAPSSAVTMPVTTPAPVETPVDASSAAPGSSPVVGPSAPPSVCIHTPLRGGGWRGIAPARWEPVTVWRRDVGVRIVWSDALLTGPDGAAREDVVRAVTDRVMAMLDGIAPFPWRTALSELVVGCAAVAGLDCPGGLAQRDRLIISPAAAGWTDAELAYVLRHELAHVWQFRTGDMPARYRDLDGLDLGAEGLDPHEVAADCLAAHWGSPSDGAGYLECPPEGVRRMAAVFAGLTTSSM